MSPGCLHHFSGLSFPICKTEQSAEVKTALCLHGLYKVPLPRLGSRAMEEGLGLVFPHFEEVPVEVVSFCAHWS